MRLHETHFALIAIPTESERDIPNLLDTRFDSSIDHVAMLSVPLGSIALTAADEQQQSHAFQSRIESLRACEVELAELHALRLVLWARGRRARSGDDAFWIEAVGVQEVVEDGRA